jgi:FlaA1/EpsC-like NDP-sugar epimerase
VAEAAAAIGADKFVMISSDKAVRPSSVMGATKRIAELLLLGLRSGRTSCLSVRFGNVIGSSGSVIPIFRRQIAAGGPVTVTDPEMSRYFIPLIEACRLVLQASAMEGGGICVLDMGHPVKIVDLARSLIRQAGLRPEIDIPIEFTGIRAGEKLSEQLSTIHEGTEPTGHNRIRVVTGGADTDDILAWIDSLRSICRERDLGRLMEAMQAMAADYTPSAALRQRAIEQHPCPSNT